MIRRIIGILALTLVLSGCASNNAKSDSEKEDALECLRTGGGSISESDSTETADGASEASR